MRVPGGDSLHLTQGARGLTETRAVGQTGTAGQAHLNGQIPKNVMVVAIEEDIQEQMEVVPEYVIGSHDDSEVV